MYYIYHLKRPDMDLSQGYIGVSNNPQRRFYEHQRSCSLPTPDNIVLARAFQKYSDIELVILFTFSSPEEAYEKELELRPSQYLGWNISIGGIRPPNQTGYIHTDESKAKIQQRSKGTNNPMYGKTGSKAPAYKPANIYNAKTHEVIATNVCINEWARNNNCRANHLHATARGDRKQTGGYYAKYNNKDIT